jgi:1,4-alpha-glucan branching enzyme
MKQEHAILLGLLQREPLYGYEIARALDQDEYEPWADQLDPPYEALAELVEQGLVARRDTDEAQERPGHAVFGLTDAGRQALQETLLDAWEEAPARSAQEVAALFMDVLPQEDALEALQARLQRLRDELSEVSQEMGALRDRGELRPRRRALYERRRLWLQSEVEWTRHLISQVESGAWRREAEEAAEARREGRGRVGEGKGAFTFVLHTHLPYARLAGRWPHGEEWIHEALAETYVPLLNALYDLRDEGVPFRLTMSLTPVLTEQLADADVREHFLVYLDEEIAAAEADIPRFGEADQPHLEHLARFYRDTYGHIKETFLERFGGDVVAAFARLQDEGHLEIITSAATHGYLPLLSRDSSVYGQLMAGVDSYRRHFHRSPRAIWLPECAYRPAYETRDGTVRPAIEEFLAPLGLTTFFVETHAIEGGRPVGKAAGDVAIGPYASIRRRYVIPMSDESGPGGTTYKAYRVVGSDRGLTEPPVSAIGRNNRTGQQVWSADWGYPGDFDYREFHKKDPESGLQYWRVTGAGIDLGSKDYYHPDWAAVKVEQHAYHYARLVEELTVAHHAETGEYGIIASNYDTELFGHWWFEGIDWIKGVLRELAYSETVDLVTASEYVAARESQEAITLPESSWGAGGTHWTWDNPETKWIWTPIGVAERRMEHLVERYPDAEGELRLALDQAARELLLLQASDWPFLITTGQAKQYAIDRFQSHLSRFLRLVDLLDEGRSTEAADLAREFYELDKVFAGIDYGWFAARQGNPA